MSEAAAAGTEPADAPHDDLVSVIEDVIRRHAYYAAGAGMIIVPGVDLLASTTVQIRMISKICDLHGVPFSEHAVKSCLAAIVTSTLPGAAVGYPLISAAKAVPVVGTLLALSAMPALNGAMTYALGRAFHWHFGGGGTLQDIDYKAMAAKVGEELENGKRAVARATRRGGGD